MTRWPKRSTEYEESGVLVPLENALDRAFYEALLSGLPDTQRSTADRAVPRVPRSRNRLPKRPQRAPHRSQRCRPRPLDYFIEGGQLFDARRSRRCRRTSTSWSRRPREPYGDDLDQALSALEEADNLIDFERALDAALLEYADRLSIRYPLSVCPVLSYVLAKEREVDNIRAIARGREAGLGPDAIEQELVIL